MPDREVDAKYGGVIDILPSRRRFFVDYILSMVSLGIGAGMLYLPLQIPLNVQFIDPKLFFATFFLVSALLLLTYSELRRYVEKYRITKREVSEDVGYFDKRSTSLPFIKIERCEVERSFLQRILRIGDVRVDAGTDHFIIKGVGNPEGVRGMIRERMSGAMDRGSLAAVED